MNNHFRHFFYITVLGLSAALSTNAFANPLTLRLGHVGAVGHTVDVGSHELARLVAEKSEGQIKIEVYPTGQLGGNREMLEGLQLGTVDMVIASVGALGGFNPSTAIFDLPYLFVNEEHAEAVLDGAIGQSILAELESSGFIGLAWMSHGWRHLTTANREVRHPDDLRGLKIRTQENPLHIDHFNTLGASAIPMAYSEIFTSLQQGVIDGQENPYSGNYLMGFYEVQNYIIETGHIYDPMPVLISRQVWNRMSDTQKELLRDAAVASLPMQRQDARDQDNHAKQQISAAGVTIIELSAEEREVFFDAVQGLYQRHSGNIGADRIAEIIDTGNSF